MKNMMIKLSILCFFLVFLVSCGNDSKEQTGENVETKTSGKMDVWIDEALWPMLEKPILLYEQDYPDVELNYHVASAHRAMSMLLAGETRAVCIARGYTDVEDSLRKKYRVEKHNRFDMAIDGLVLFANKDFPLDTLNDSQVKKYLTEDNYSLKSDFPELVSDPAIATLNAESSQWFNLNKIVADGRKINRKIRTFDTTADLKKFISENDNTLGVLYLSQLAKDTSRFKMIKIGYTDSLGVAIKPKPVHQGWIVQGYYPYFLKLWVYLQEKRTNLPHWFALYLSREGKIQKHFLESGIVPAYANIELKPEGY